MSTTTQTSYQEGLKGLRGNLTEMIPADELALFDQDAAALEATHQSILQLQVGDTAPDFTLSNATGESINLAELLQQGKVVLTFYRGTWCPYCNLQLHLYQQVIEEIKKAGAQLVAVSPQTPDESLSIKEKNELSFEVLSDNGNLVARQYTTVFRNADTPVAAMERLGIDFDSFYADDSRELPVPAVFIIEKDARVSFAQAIGGDYRNRVEAKEILDALNA